MQPQHLRCGVVAACMLTAALRSWVLKLPDCMVADDSAPDFPASRARMRAGAAGGWLGSRRAVVAGTFYRARWRARCADDMHRSFDVGRCTRGTGLRFFVAAMGLKRQVAAACAGAFPCNTTRTAPAQSLHVLVSKID